MPVSLFHPTRCSSPPPTQLPSPPRPHTHNTQKNRPLRSTYGLESLVCLGGFDNLRREFAWSPPSSAAAEAGASASEGGGAFTLELDATAYPWGKLYELECETVRDRDGG